MMFIHVNSAQGSGLGSRVGSAAKGIAEESEEAMVCGRSEQSQVRSPLNPNPKAPLGMNESM